MNKQTDPNELTKEERRAFARLDLDPATITWCDCVHFAMQPFYSVLSSAVQAPCAGHQRSLPARDQCVLFGFSHFVTVAANRTAQLLAKAPKRRR